MKRLLLASLCCFALASGSALAADLALKAPPPVPTWTGCYIDGGGGYGMWKQDHYSELGPAPFVQESPTVSTGGEGWLGRVGAGCDYQFSTGNLGNWVIGVFGDYDFTSLSGTFQEPFTGWIGNEKESGAWAVGLRIGYLVTPTLLTYFNGGYTQARFDQINGFSWTAPPVTLTPTGDDLPATTYSGWFIGGGTEYALTFLPLPGLFWRNEYRFSRYDGADVPGQVTATGAPYTVCDSVCGSVAEHMQKDVQTITTSLVWRFNWLH